MRITVYLVVLSLLSALLLIHGLRGLVSKRPVIYPARFRYWFMVLGLAPATVSSAELIFDPVYGSRDLFSFLPVSMFVGLLVYSWWELSGYFASGVTNETFRQALHTSLAKLNLPYTDSHSRVELTSVGAHLKTTVRPWMGAALLKVKPRKHKQLLRDIALNMNEFYKSAPVKLNLASSIVDISAGLIALLVLIYLIASRMGRGV